MSHDPGARQAARSRHTRPGCTGRRPCSGSGHGRAPARCPSSRASWMRPGGVGRAPRVAPRRGSAARRRRRRPTRPTRPVPSRSAAGGSGTGARPTAAPSMPKPSLVLSCISSTVRLVTASESMILHELDVAVRELAVGAGEVRVERVPDLDRELAADVGGVEHEEGERVELAEPADLPLHAEVVVAVEPVAAERRARGAVAAPGHGRCRRGPAASRCRRPPSGRCRRRRRR